MPVSIKETFFQKTRSFSLIGDPIALRGCQYTLLYSSVQVELQLIKLRMRTLRLTSSLLISPHYTNIFICMKFIQQRLISSYSMHTHLTGAYFNLTNLKKMGGLMPKKYKSSMKNVTWN